MRTLIGCGIAVVIVFAVLSVAVWFARPPWAMSLRIFSAGFVLGMPGMYVASVLYGYHQWRGRHRVAAFGRSGGLTA